MSGAMNGAAPSKDFFLLKNWENGKISRDTLFRKGSPTVACNGSLCKGSVVSPAKLIVDPRTWDRPIEETQRLAREFIDQYYESTKRNGTEAHVERLEEVRKSIEATETYTLTEQELIYGAKMSWRNSARCIARIQWQKLHVYDCRHMTTTSEMFEAMCTHLRYATNNGNVRSAITMFAPRRKGGRDFRIWNSQMIRYAGYQQTDGSVIGDPANTELTDICQRLGWKGKGGRFDLLPMVLQANGEDPDWYELPEDLVLEVKLRHPEYKCFEEMDLKWYAMPSVSNMLVDIGGVQFCACPFNGWFMGTEVARDLLDVSRYDLLKPLARNMGLDTSNLSSLWKDKAMLEMNMAIIHSFQADRITIMDHHVATESFMKHFENEMKLRNGCPGDWVWLVPPLTGSATPIFHQEILNYVLNPNCYYQTDPWKHHNWKNPAMQQPNRSPVHFRGLARTIRMTSSLMAKVMSKRTKVTILYATETGKSKMYAELLQKIFNFAFNAKVYPMSDYNIWRLEFEPLVLVVTSTFGNGDPPENAEEFAELLLQRLHGDLKPDPGKRRFSDFANQAPVSERQSYNRVPGDNDVFLESQGVLANVKFSVFGLGSTAYPSFCAFAHAMDTMLGEMGAERLLQIGEGDELAGQEESFKGWAKNVFTMACQAFCLKDVNMKDAIQALGLAAYDKNNFRVAVQNSEATENSFKNNLARLHHKKTAVCKLAERVDLHSRHDDRATILVKLQKEDPSQLQFEPGDHLGIFPENDPELVEELLNNIQDVPEKSTLIKLECKSPKGGWDQTDRLPVCSVWNAFSRYLDITTPPTPQMLKLLGECATNNKDKSKLELLGKGLLEYDDWKNSEMYNIVEVLKIFPSIRAELSLLLNQLPLLQCRYYSISSSPDVYPDQIHCTISVFRYRTRAGKGEVRRGVCSTYMDRIEPGEEIPCFIRQAPLFHLPAEMSTPCILVGPGTGIAPFRSFWQQRIHQMKKEENGDSSMALFFGCRQPSDRIYKDDVNNALNIGALSDSYVAYSRSPDVPKAYVQNIMADKTADYLFETLQKNKGHMYVCGDVTMAADVMKTLHKIFAKVGKMTETEAEEAIKEIKFEKRYHEDIFGVTLRTKEVHAKSVSEAMRRRSSSLSSQQ